MLFNNIDSTKEPKLDPLDSHNNYVSETEDLHHKDLLKYLPGYKWKIDYFVQNLGDTNPPSRYDPNGNNHYFNIKDIIFYVDEPVGSTNLISFLEGTGIIDLSITPNVGDVFIATLMGNRVTLFEITAVEKLSYNLNRVYKLTYRVHSTVDYDDYIITNLLNRVVKTYYTTHKGLVSEEFRENLKNIEDEYESLYNYYSSEFIQELTIFTLPLETYQIHDFNLATLVSYLYPTKAIKILDKVTLKSTLTKAIIKRDYRIFKNIIGNSVVLSKAIYGKYQYLKLNLGVDYMLRYDIYDSNYLNYPIDSKLDITNPINPTIIPKVQPLKIVKIDENSNTLTVLESTILNYIKGNMNTIKADIDTLLGDIDNWSSLEKSYYIPLILIILKGWLNDRTR